MQPNAKVHDSAYGQKEIRRFRLISQIAYINANEPTPWPLGVPGTPKHSHSPGVYTSTKRIGRPAPAITGGAIRPVATGLGMESIGNYESAMVVLDIGASASFKPKGNRTGGDAVLEISGKRKGLDSDNDGGNVYARPWFRSFFCLLSRRVRCPHLSRRQDSPDL